jgi:hypothetical protein
MEDDHRALWDHGMVCTIGQSVEKGFAGLGGSHGQLFPDIAGVVKHENFQAPFDDMEGFTLSQMLMGPDNDHLVKGVFHIGVGAQADAPPFVF